MSSELDSMTEAGAAARSVLRIYRKSELPREAAALIAGALGQAVRERGTASLMLAGGTTPRATYEVLATEQSLQWDRVSVFFGDERCVPATDLASNYAMARASLLDHVPIQAAAIFRMQAEHPDIEAAARAYEAILPDCIDVVVLGVGVDGHTASLFPQAAALDLQGKRVVVAVAPSLPALRLTVSPDVITSARARFMLAAGAEKGPAVARALEGPLDVRACPAQLGRGGQWLLDDAAAHALSAQLRRDLARPKPTC